MPNSKPRVHKRSSSGEAMCGRGGAHPRLTAYTDEVTCTYCALGVTGISGHPEAHAEAKRAQMAAPDFPDTIPAAPTDDRDKRWRVIDDSGNATDHLTPWLAREVMDSVRGSSARYRREDSGEWRLYETLLRGADR